MKKTVRMRALVRLMIIPPLEKVGSTSFPGKVEVSPGYWVATYGTTTLKPRFRYSALRMDISRFRDG